jgi:hypothetical protein
VEAWGMDLLSSGGSAGLDEIGKRNFEEAIRVTALEAAFYDTSVAFES